ncbi:hypothetical protein [Allobranchiibius sp. CTAmp26]|uniref:hypothetical protein n=1 Tax=Allobranchiibius sp. CTAmp26 TaxID=2815214 RepID=UPI001AA18836|nr:hypothetical protein [Allobranchiibius sp. CTAmp26]MBO1753683.1 hypothetical protein [Allobranchiibius sp. CTAmp26]
MADTDTDTDVVKVQAFGHTLAIEVPDPASAGRVRGQWARCLADGSADATVDSVRYGAEFDLDFAEYTVVSSVTLRLIQLCAGRLMMLHAAGVADPGTGAVIALVAESGTGKTTAAQRLCTTGFGYVTDETVAVREDGQVLPFPKPLSVIIEGEDHKQQHGPDELGLLAAPEHPDLRLHRIVLLERDGAPGDPPRVEQLALLDAILALIPQLSFLTKMADPLLTLTRHVRSCGGIHRLRYTEIQECADTLRKLVADDPAEVAEVEHLPPTGTPARGQVGSYHRGAYADAVRIDDEILLLIEDLPIRCSGLGATVWDATAQPRTAEELVDICIEMHGEHPDADALVRAAVEELCRYGVLAQG